MTHDEEGHVLAEEADALHQLPDPGEGPLLGDQSLGERFAEEGHRRQGQPGDHVDDPALEQYRVKVSSMMFRQYS